VINDFLNSLLSGLLKTGREVNRKNGCYILCEGNFAVVYSTIDTSVSPMQLTRIVTWFPKMPWTATYGL
jgi:hypothetical protein